VNNVCHPTALSCVDGNGVLLVLTSSSRRDVRLTYASFRYGGQSETYVSFIYLRMQQLGIDALLFKGLCGFVVLFRNATFTASITAEMILTSSSAVRRQPP